MSADIPESRVYVHDGCGEATEVGSPHFAALADPLSPPRRTICASCGAAFSLDCFRWEDTDERLTDYALRHQARCSGLDRFLGSRTAGLLLGGLGVALGGVVGFLTLGWLGGAGATIAALVAAAVLSIAGLVAWDAVLKPVVVRRSLGVDDCRRLT